MARLLILDDDESTLSWMSEALKERGHQVSAFASAGAALPALAKERPDLIVSDILLPEMDGLTFARLARRYKGVPVMFVSITTKHADAILAGAVGYLQKPATAAELRAAVERALGNLDRRNTLLVVDDDEDTRSLYSSFLEPQFEVLEAEHGRQGLEVLRTHRVDLVLLDVHMPVMNGAEMLRAMRHDPAFERVPVIVQTSDMGMLDAHVWRELNASQVVGKYDFLRWLDVQIHQHVDAAPASL